MIDDDKSLGDDATLGGESPEQEIDAQSLGDQSTHGDHSQMDSVGDSSSLGDQLTFGGDESGAELDDGMQITDLDERYTIEGELGKGGMGEVLLATDTRLNRKVAIKRILAKSARSAKAYQRFLNGAQTIAALNHPNIVQLFDFGRDADGPFMILEYVSGGSLLDRCKQGPIPLEEAIDITCQLCDGLAKAHAAGITHRDIKPANVLMTEDGIPKLTDFDLAKEQLGDTGMTMAGAVLGTLDFMPPEQRKDATQVDARSDLWSLAATLYQMLTGETPRVIDLDAVPRELRTCLAQALKTNKDDRYQNAAELGAALRECLTVSAHLPISELGSGECPSCHTRNQANRKFCNECAGPLRAPCFACDSEIPVWDKVCGECGSNQHEKITQLQEERAKQRDKAERLLNDNDYDGATEMAEKLRVTANNRIADPPGWLDNYLAKISSQQESELKSARLLMDEAIAHRDAHDYRAGLTVLDKIPRSLRRQTIPAHDKTPAELREVFKLRLTQIQTLGQEIKQRVKNRELDGLGKLVSELQGLQPGRPDLARLTQKLNERDARYAEMVDKALADASTFRQHCEFSKAVEKILEIPEKFRSEEVNALLTNCETLADYRESALRAISQANRSRFADYGNEKREKIQLAILRCGVYLKSLESAGITDAEIQEAHTLYQEQLAQKKSERAARQRGMQYKIGIGGVALAVVFGLVIALVLSGQRSQRSSAIAEALKRGDFATVLEIDPSNADAQAMQKNAAAIEQALAHRDYKAALSLDPSNTEAVALKQAAIKQALDKGDWIRALLLDPGNAEATALKANSQALGTMQKQKPTTIEGHTGIVDCVAFSPDGKRIVSSDSDGNVVLWDVETGILWKRLTGHTDWVNCVTFSPDNQWIASGSDDGTIILESSTAGENFENERKTLTGHQGAVRSLAFSPDGRWVLSGGSYKGNGTVKLWDVENGEEIRTFTGHDRVVHSVAFSPDGQQIASGGGRGTGVIKFWDVTTGKILSSLATEGTVMSVAFSPDGKQIASGSMDGTICLWDVESGKEIDKLEGHTEGVWGVTFSPDGHWIASGSWDKTIKLWEVESGKELGPLRVTSRVHSVAFSPDGRTIASGSSDNTIKLWDVGDYLDVLERFKTEYNSEK